MTPAKPHRLLPEHLRVPWGILDALAVFLAPWIVLPFVVIAACYLLAPAFPAAKQVLQALADGNLTAAFVLTLGEVAVAAAAIGWNLRRYKVSWATVGFRPFSPFKAVAYLAIILVGFLVVVSALLWLISLLSPGFNANQSQTNEFTTAATTHRNLALIALVVIPPIVEESVFRGFVFPAFANRLGLVWGAIASSVLFGLAHWQANVTIYTFILGLLLCFMYIKLRSIVPGIALHMLNNYLAFMALGHK